MKDFNQIIIEGHLAKDPVMYTTGNKPQTFLTVATNRVWTTQENGKVVKHEMVEYHNISCFGKLAELNVQFVHVGSKVRVVGRMHYENKEMPVELPNGKPAFFQGKPLTYWTCKPYINAFVVDWLDNKAEEAVDGEEVSEGGEEVSEGTSVGLSQN